MVIAADFLLARVMISNIVFSLFNQLASLLMTVYLIRLIKLINKLLAYCFLGLSLYYLSIQGAIVVKYHVG